VAPGVAISGQYVGSRRKLIFLAGQGVSSFHRLVLTLAIAVIALGTTRAMSTPPCAYAQENVWHIVQPGENLFRIGLKYGVSWSAIMQVNGLSNTLIYPGQRLLIPLATFDAASGVTLSPPPAPSGGVYVVQQGDTLFRIAARYHLTPQQLATANGIRNPSLIYVGQTLIIPEAAEATTSAAFGGNVSYRSIVVDISDQRLYAYEREQLVYNFVVSTGMATSPTRPGNYQVLNKIPNAYASTWDLWMPNWLGIYWVGNLQNGIHALPILSNGQRLWAGYLGTPVSYGCIILGVNEAQQLYDWAEVGTAVTIRY